LLAQVDSSIGGKVGINTPHGKNLIGAIHQPRAVLADTDVLKTLPARELAAGLYEVVKCGAIRSVPLLKFLEGRVPDILACSAPALIRTVVEAARIKATVVSSDELESADRMILNFGHTVGHALETATGYRRFKHGEAVAWGMIAAAHLSAAWTGLSSGEQGRLVRLIQRIEMLPPLRGISRDHVWTAIQRDKKSDGGRLRMVLLSKLGRAEIVDDFDPIVLRRFLATFLQWGSDGG
jgi:3-dehydroquinate synthase